MTTTSVPEFQHRTVLLTKRSTHSNWLARAPTARMWTALLAVAAIRA
jgi:hypothetical protein